VHIQRACGLKNVTLWAGLSILVAFAPWVGAQSPPPWTSPVATPKPSPTPVPDLSDGRSPTPTGDQQEAGSAAAAMSPTPVAETGAEESQTADGDVVTNPGAVAFTDYRPFGLDEIEPEPFKSKWKQFVAGMRGLGRYSLFDGKLKFRIGGKAQFDGTTGSGSSTYEESFGPIETEYKVRRLQAYSAGRYRKFNFNVEFELGPDWGVSDAWIEGAEGGLEVWGHYLGKLRVGAMNEPFSLERQSSSYNIGFMERSLPVQTLAPGTNIGAMVHDSGPKGRFTWAVGLFSIGQKNDNNASNSALSITGRYTYCPINRDEGRRLLHFGLSLSARSPSGGDVRYRSRPEARFVDYLVDTGDIASSNIALLGLEFAAIRGPLWMAAEYIQSDVSAQLVGSPNFGGSYVQVGWFLTGESKPYRNNSGTFDRLRPTHKYHGGNPFKKTNGGAWEVNGRVSTVDLTDGDVNGGRLTDFTAALSWFPNATTRIELNYIYASPRDHGSANIFLMRLQYQPW
jgi:phosphate-selective porin OprO/OprP